MARTASFFGLTVAQVSVGISLCRANARRLLTDASALLDHGGRTGIAYALWSLAVEEYGKAVLLDELTKGKASGDIVSVPQRLFRGQHKEKFESGFGRIQQVVGNRLADVVKVLQNMADLPTIISDPSALTSVIVPARVTGEFEDLTPGSNIGQQASHLLRLDLLYVDWDDARKAWREPEPDLQVPRLVGHFTISRHDLRRAIRALNHELGSGAP